MKLELKSTSKLLLALALSSTLSACGQPEMPRSVSDFCLVDQTISVSVAPGPKASDPANEYDTDETTNQALKHNEVHDKLCPPLVKAPAGK